MKYCLTLLAALVAVAMSAVSIHNMIRQEVHYLYRVDSDMSVDHCTTKCDALFDLVAANDEHMTDRWCHYECACQKNHTCLSHLRTTTALPPRTTMMRTDVPTTNPPSSVP